MQILFMFTLSIGLCLVQHLFQLYLEHLTYFWNVSSVIWNAFNVIWNAKDENWNVFGEVCLKGMSSEI